MLRHQAESPCRLLNLQRVLVLRASPRQGRRTWIHRRILLAEHYLQLLATETDPAKRAMIEMLLAEAEAKLVDDGQFEIAVEGRAGYRLPLH